MKIEERNGYTTLRLSEDDTFRWAAGWDNGKTWPCSVARGKALDVTFQPNGDLVDYTLHGSDEDMPGDELTALTTDYLPAGHPARRDWV